MSDDFQAKFGTNNDNPDVRHPDYITGYVGGAGGLYMSNEFMNILQGTMKQKVMIMKCICRVD